MPVENTVAIPNCINDFYTLANIKSEILTH
jgi:hypothetical protein